MSDEIKEILDKAKEISDYGADGKQHTRMFNQFEAKALLDYITNLQQENENLKDFNNKLQATKDRLDKYDRENQLEIDRLNNIINELEEYCKEEYYRKNTTDIDSIGLSNNIYVCIYMKLKELKENNNAKD